MVDDDDSDLRPDDGAPDDGAPGAGGPVRRPPLVVALAAQAVAALIVFGTAYGVGAAAGVRPALMTSLWLQGGVAAFLGLRFGLPVWWVPIHVALPPAVGYGLALQVPGWVFAAAFAALVLVYWNAARGVPLYLTNPTTRDALAGLLPEAAGFRFADLGCGLGGPVLALARNRSDGRFTGVESAPLLFALCWLRRRLAGAGTVRLVFGDYRNLDLGPFDVVYCFLSPVPMPDVFAQARRQMRPGSLLVSNTFAVPGRAPSETVVVADRRHTRLYLFRM